LRDVGNNGAEISGDLLRWYDSHARVLPWRVSPADRAAGVSPDPYRVWLSEVMLQQTTVAAVKGYFERFTTLWPDVAALAAADDGLVMAEWAGLGYYARARNLLACARSVVADHSGQFPDDAAALRSLPGIGPYTAAAIGSIAFDRPETVVDGNVERVVSRLFRVESPLPAAKPELTRLAETLTPDQRAGDHAQAMMDLGATICTPRNPACGICPVIAHCQARAAGIAADLPAKPPKKPKPVRHGFAYVARRTDGAWLLERRPDKGLLGGTLGWPGSDWSDNPAPAPPVEAAWAELGEVRHTFTHFHLRLRVFAATVAQSAPGAFIPADDFDPNHLPTLMRKAHSVASGALGAN